MFLPTQAIHILFCDSMINIKETVIIDWHVYWQELSNNCVIYSNTFLFLQISEVPECSAEIIQ